MNNPVSSDLCLLSGFEDSNPSHIFDFPNQYFESKQDFFQGERKLLEEICMPDISP